MSPIYLHAITTLAMLAVPCCTPAQVPLKTAFKADFPIGVAVNAAQVTGQDRQGRELIRQQFNSISPENAMKWSSIHPRPGVYSFDLADRYVDFGEKNHMMIVGHTLVWNNQTPAWVFHNPDGSLVDRDTLLQRLHDHIQTVVGPLQGPHSELGCRQ